MSNVEIAAAGAVVAVLAPIYVLFVDRVLDTIKSTK